MGNKIRKTCGKHEKMCFEIRCRYKPVSRLPTLQTLWKKPHSASCAVDENIDSGMLNKVADAKSEYIP